MNQEFTRILVALSLFGACGFTAQLSAAESAAQRDAPAATAEQIPGGQAGEPAAAGAAPPSTENEPSAEDKPGAEAKPAGAAKDAVKSTAEDTEGADKQTSAEKAAAQEKGPEPVTGAFGIPLNERFDPCMVAKIIGQEETTYLGLDKVKVKGTLYRVEPKVANPLFNAYSVVTTADGIIVSVRGDYEPAEKGSKCEVSKRLSTLLVDKYGKPRGKGMLADWFAFRDMTSDLYRGVRLYAPKCRNGRYSIVYTDNNAKTDKATPAPESTETSGL